jgi:hypothetical protein
MKARYLHQWPLLTWVCQTNPAFHGYRYMRVTGDAVLIASPTGDFGSTFADQFRGRRFEEFA